MHNMISGRSCQLEAARFFIADLCSDPKLMLLRFRLLFTWLGIPVQGPDHSSGYLERFLQLANDDPDHLPGLGPAHRAEMEAGFAAADTSAYIALNSLCE